MKDLKSSFSAWKNLLGPEHVSDDENTLKRLGQTTFATCQRIPAIIRPANRAQVQECLRIANHYKTPVYPISRGRNWGYGSAVPARDGCVVMDLARMNRIVDYDENLAYVTLEPGVTQQQLFEFLRAQNSNLFMSATGAPPDSSLIGNILDRGLGEGPYGDRFQYVCGMEAVLPTGDCIHTGFGRFPGAKASRVGHWGVGPYLDGLFTQSNLGVVTGMTLWLTPYPKYFQSFYYAIKEEARLAEVIDTVRDLKLNRVIETAFVIANDFRALPLTQQYPWEQSGMKTPLPDGVREHLRRTFLGGSLWSGTGALYSNSKAQGRVVRRLIKKALRDKVDRIVFFDARTARLAQMQIAQSLLKRLFGFDAGAFAKFFFDKNPQRGIPITEAAGLAYWRKRSPVPVDIDPDRDRCGLIWCSPLIPFDGRHARNALGIIEAVVTAHGFEPNIGLNCATDRSIVVTVGIAYDREVPGEDRRASDCHDRLLDKLTEAGYVPYRLSIVLRPSKFEGHCPMIRHGCRMALMVALNWSVECVKEES